MEIWTRQVWNEQIWNDIDKSVQEEMGCIRFGQKVLPSVLFSNNAHRYRSVKLKFVD